MMDPNVPATCGEEMDAFSRKWRRCLNWRAGRLKKAKNAYRKRCRQKARLEIARLQGENV